MSISAPRVRLLASAVAAAAALVLAGCSSEPAPAPQDLGGGSGSYSLTQTLTNNSGTDLTVQSATADNGGTVEPGHPTVVRNGTAGTFRATNTGNGVQLDLTLTAGTGQILKVYSDNPRVSANWSAAVLTGTPGGMSTGAIAIDHGDSPTATFTLEPCAPNAQCTTQSSTPAAPAIPVTG
ncbi:hypothetical protein WCD74_26060 [Actinomycetospora sp. OC33-EN08]|uniref:Secreted protein n=1 Tax=Actinomycetospora aurantiaca TaxID=3129233 RepID=A0ABU8MVB9_9PSEU